MHLANYPNQNLPTVSTDEPVPKLDLRRQDLFAPRNPVAPVFDYASLAKSIVGPPRTNVSKQRKDSFPVRCAARELLTATPQRPHSQHLAEGFAIREDEIHAPDESALGLASREREVAVRFDVELVVLSKELKSRDFRDCLRKLLNRPSRFENKYVLRNSAASIHLCDSDSILERTLQRAESLAEPLLLPSRRQRFWSPSTSAPIRSLNGNGRW